MSRTTTFALILVVAAFGLGCIEEYFFTIPDSSNSFLIVEGQITDEPGPYFVKLSKSVSINSSEVEPVSTAEIQIEKEGMVYKLVQLGDGLYASEGFQAEPEANYRLSISLDGSQYQSSWQKLKASPEMDSVYYIVDEEETENPDVAIDGIQWFVDRHGQGSDAELFRYQWDETWQIGVSWPTFEYYVGNDLTEPIPVEDRRNTCWINKPSSKINLTSTSTLSENVVSEHPLFFASDEEERFTIKYSLLVRQYALEEDEYEFWRALRESNAEGGNLFDKQPASVVGNIINISDPEETVLGFFSANGVTEQRVFVTRRELPQGFGFPPRCQLDTTFKADVGNYEELVSKKIDGGLLFYQKIMSPFSPAIIGVTLSEPACADCVVKGGDEQKPDFW